MTDTKRAYCATIKGIAIPGFRVEAANSELARMELEREMERRGYFERVCVWASYGKIVEEVK